MCKNKRKKKMLEDKKKIEGAKPSSSAVSIKSRASSKTKNEAEPPPRKLSAWYNPPKPPSRWLLWQTYFALRCFHDDIYRTRTINRVVAPFVLSTQIVALQKGATGKTLEFLTNFLHFNGFYGAKDFEHDLLQVLQDFPFNKASTTEIRSIVAISKFIFCNDLKPSSKWEKFSKEAMKLEVYSLKSSSIGDKYQAIQRYLNEAIGAKFSVTREETLCRNETKLLSIVGTRIKASFATAQTYGFKKAPFLLSYGMKDKQHSYFIAKGQFSNVTFNDFEAWRLPLKHNDKLSNGGASHEPKMSLILVRPILLGQIIDLESTDTFDEIAKAINVLLQRKLRKATLLIPRVDLPIATHTTYGITDLIINWRQSFGNEVTSHLGNVADGIFTSCPLDRFFHCASIRISSSGISFQGDKEDRSKQNSLETENSYKAKPKIPVEETRSAKIQKMVDAHKIVPESLIKPRRERLHHFSARFDSPFLFFIVDEKWASILMAGCYSANEKQQAYYRKRGGTRTMSKTKTSKASIQKTDGKKKKSLEKKKCCVC